MHEQDEVEAPAAPARRASDPVWTWTVVTLLALYIAGWLDEQPGTGGSTLTAVLLSLVAVWPVVIGAGLFAGTRDPRSGWRAPVAWIVAGIWTLVVGGAITFWSGDVDCADTAVATCWTSGVTRFAVAASIAGAWAVAQTLAIWRRGRASTASARR